MAGIVAGFYAKNGFKKAIFWVFLKMRKGLYLWKKALEEPFPAVWGFGKIRQKVDFAKDQRFYKIVDF